MPEFYRHWKGGIYKKKGEHLDADHNDYPTRVLYVDTQTKKEYSCSSIRWNELVLYQGVYLPRFRQMTEEEVAKYVYHRGS